MVEMHDMFLRTSSVEVASMICAVYVILVLGLCHNSQLRSTRFDRTQHKYK